MENQVREDNANEIRAKLIVEAAKKIACNKLTESEVKKLIKAVVKGVNIYNGKCVYENVAKAFDIKYTELSSLL